MVEGAGMAEEIEFGTFARHLAFWLLYVDISIRRTIASLGIDLDDVCRDVGVTIFDIHGPSKAQEVAGWLPFQSIRLNIHGERGFGRLHRWQHE